MHTVFLLAAGFGTRLRPLTNHRPKPLLPLLGRPMLDYALAHLCAHGHSSFLVNAHHLWEHVAMWASENTNDRQNIEIQVELPEILGTGGGLKMAQSKMAERFLVWNGDIFSDIHPHDLLQACPENGASMALCHSDNLGSTTQLLFETNEAHSTVTRIGSVCKTDDAGEFLDPQKGWHFSGIHALHRSTLDMVPEGFQCIVRTAYTQLVPAKQVHAHLHRGVWVDIGTPLEYWKANMDALDGKYQLSIDVWSQATDQHKGSWVSKAASVQGKIEHCVVGKNAVVPVDASLHNCVVWDGVTVPSGEYKNCVFFDGGVLEIAT